MVSMVNPYMIFDFLGVFCSFFVFFLGGGGGWGEGLQIKSYLGFYLS